MRRYLYIMLVTCFFTTPVQAGIFDTIRQKAEEKVNETIDKAVDEAIDKTQPDQSGQNEPATSQGQNTQNSGTSTDGQVNITSVEDLYGQWEGQVIPAKSGYHYMSGMTVHIILSLESNSMRVSAAGTPHCLAELEPTAKLGQYQAIFIDETQSCGSSALVTFASDGNVTVNFENMPNADSTGNVFSGQLTKSVAPYERHWSASEDIRNSMNIVGLYLGMTYEDALAYLDENHSDFKREIKFVIDAGTKSIILNLTESDAKTVGPAVYGEQLALVFESQTPEEIDVDQPPEVLAAIEERDKIIKQRDEMIAQQRSTSLRVRSRSAAADQTADTQAPLPEIPEMPKLRPDGAVAELVLISRQIQYGNRTGPHPDNVIDALSKKYGSPSILIKKPGSAGEQSLLSWDFDPAGNFLDDAEGTACDQLSPAALEIKKTAHHYTVLTGGATGIYNSVWVSPACGLTMKTEIRTETDGSVWRILSTVYDQQRLLGDEWYRTLKLAEALISEQKAKSKTIENRDIPDF